VKSPRPFLILWTLAVSATVSAFVLHLALRGKNVEFGYELGKARAEQARLREVKRVLELEGASYETPQRVEIVARTLLGMQPPAADRIIPMSGLVISPQAAPAPLPSAKPPSSPDGPPLVGARAER
jgi:cell division protein FtsL